MFVRKKRNKSGLVSIQVIDKSSGKYKVVKTVGCSSDEREQEKLFAEGQQWIKSQLKQGKLDLDKEQALFSKFISGIEQIRIIGTELLLGKIFDEIGFEKIPNPLFRQLVIMRLCFPGSKLKTTDFLNKYYCISVDEDKVYRYLDKLYNTQKETVQEISYQHTLKILNNTINIVFYDVTTLYFEINDEDDLRKTGFSSLIAS